MDWRKENILVIGAGRSGITAASLTKRFGAAVRLYDAKKKADISFDLSGLEAQGVQLLLGGEPPALTGVTQIIVSPAVPIRLPIIQEAYQRGIRVMSEVELAYRLAGSPICAVTGTNGKTTTTTLLGQLLKTAYPKVGVGGNIGLPLSEEALRIADGGIIAAEISSYQMEATAAFRPKIAVILNVTPDHVVRHGSLEVYRQMKEKIFAQQAPEDFLILNYDNELTRGMAQRAPSQVCFFSRCTRLEEGAFVADGWLVIRWQGVTHRILPVSDLKLRGGHNVENVLAASAAAFFAGCEPSAMALVLRQFAGVEHRIERVAEVAGVTYYNDSKATNTDSAIKALESFPDAPVVLIAGGRDKMTDLGEFMGLVKERCAALILLGEAAERFREAALASGIDASAIHEAGHSLARAVELAHSLAKPPQIVLLSPACASFDMFGSFKERGSAFKALVGKLEETAP